MSAPELEGVKRKVRALLATAAPGSGATDPERATARRLADALMLRHGLTEWKVRESFTDADPFTRVPKDWMRPFVVPVYATSTTGDASSDEFLNVTIRFY